MYFLLYFNFMGDELLWYHVCPVLLIMSKYTVGYITTTVNTLPIFIISTIESFCNFSFVVSK